MTVTTEDPQHWGGYILEKEKLAFPNDYFTKIQGCWRIKNINCPAKGKDDMRVMSIWIGLDGHKSYGVQQLGVDVDCDEGTPVIEPWTEMYPDTSDHHDPARYPIQWNDKICASVTYNKPSKKCVATFLGFCTHNVPQHTYTLRMENKSRNWASPIIVIASRMRSAKRSLTNASAEWIVEQHHPLKLPNAVVEFSNASYETHFDKQCHYLSQAHHVLKVRAIDPSRVFAEPGSLQANAAHELSGFDVMINRGDTY
jgi:hypothetical protein